jgi:hypothetical protein
MIQTQIREAGDSMHDWQGGLDFRAIERYLGQIECGFPML